MLLILLSWGCGGGRVESLENELKTATARIEALEQRVAALEERPSVDPDDDDLDPDTRRRALMERLEARRAARGAVDTGDADPVEPEVWDGPETAREFFASDASIEDASKMGRFLLHRGADGEFDGYRVSAVRRGSLLDRVGLANGDIIHSVDGLPLTSLEEAMAAYQTLSDGSERQTVEVEITRRGERQTIAIDLDAKLADMGGTPDE